MRVAGGVAGRDAPWEARRPCGVAETVAAFYESVLVKGACGRGQRTPPLSATHCGSRGIHLHTLGVLQSPCAVVRPPGGRAACRQPGPRAGDALPRRAVGLARVVAGVRHPRWSCTDASACDALPWAASVHALYDRCNRRVADADTRKHTLDLTGVVCWLSLEARSWRPGARVAATQRRLSTGSFS